MVVMERGSRGSVSGFRLSGRDSVSSASLYKQRIDSMFDEERSVISQTYGTGQPPSLPSRGPRPKAPSIVSGRLDGPGGLTQTTTAGSGKASIGRNSNSGNSVQASIERMFSELALETDGGTPGAHSFSVDYLGSTPLPRRVTSLAGLQAPLAKLYLAYRRSRPVNPTTPPELEARLDISRAGLHVRHCGPRGDLEQLNPFPTIAVWSAVKFVLQPKEEDSNIIQYAFLPLITDPDNIDKRALFKDLEPSEKKYILGRDINAHSPLFTVVMRKIGVAKQLECHGFVCQTSEDAIVIAATLYKSLMAHMSRVPRARGGLAGPSIASSSAPVRPPRRKRTPSSLSNESDPSRSSRQESSAKPKSSKPRKSPAAPDPPPPPPPPPNKPTGIEQVKAKLASIKNDSPKTSTSPNSIYNESMEYLSNQHNNQTVKNKSNNGSKHSTSDNNNNTKKSTSSKDSSVRSKVSEKIELFSGLEKIKEIPRPATLPPPVPTKPTENKPEPKEENEVATRPGEPLRRSHSLRNSCEPGDILTKVAIPRSGSFLNASGLSRYKSTGQRNNGKKGGGSPLGFSELFNEFRVQEDLHSMDDILGAIIDAEGMSFNDLKPIYKEFLLKLAVTLTKDELFQHSKNIMRRQKKKLLRRNSTVQNKRKKMIIGARGLKLVFRKPFGKDILKTKLLHIGEKKHAKLSPFDLPKLPASKKKLIVTSESSNSTSSYDLRHFHPKEATTPAPPKRHSVRRRNSKRAEVKEGHHKSGGKGSKRQGKARNTERVSTSEDSDFLTLSRRLGCQNRNSSSGYVSCSECESEGCVDRCYCAAKVRPASAQPRPPPPVTATENCCTREDKCCDCTGGESSRCYSCCGCDTESCADSDKCYCPTSLLGAPPHAKAGARGGRGARRRSAPGPATLDSLYYEPLRPKGRGFSDMKGLEFLAKRNSRFDSFSRMSCMTDLGRSPSELGRAPSDLGRSPSEKGRSVSGLSRGGRKSYSSDNLALDYDLFLAGQGMGHHAMKGGSQRLHALRQSSQEALITHKQAEVAALFSGRLLSAHRGLYRGPSAALADSLGYLP